MEIEQQYIKDVENLVPCPHIALDVLAIAHESECSIPKLAGKIEQDPNLTANMLRMANSAYFGHMKKITSITDIIVRLGLETVKLIAITSASVGVLKTPQQSYDLETPELWYHSYATATLAAIIGRYAKITDPASLYTAALLHDVGKVLLNRPLQVESYNHEERQPEMAMIDYEQLLLHTDHAKVGQALLESWELPDIITLPVGLHHTRQNEHPFLSKTKQQLVDIVYLSNSLVNCSDLDPDDPQKNFFRALDFEDQRSRLPKVPKFEENMQVIIEEFYEKFSETISVFEL